jgi:hypothetical protein
MYYLQLQGHSVIQARNHYETGSKQSFMLASCMAYHCENLKSMKVLTVSEITKVEQSLSFNVRGVRLL